MYSFTACNVSVIIWKEKKIRENWLIFSGILGGAKLILRILGAKKKYFQGVEDFFQGSGEINPFFSVVKGAQTPPPRGLRYWLLPHILFLHCRWQFYKRVQ